MATKNLARTIIEGGRHKSNKWDRRNSHAEERARLKNYLKEVTLDPDNYDEYDPEPIQHVYKEFDDKLGPIYRWLRRQVGRPWDDVRAEVAKQFDTRTTAGRHIVYDHLLSSVQIGEKHQYGYNPEDPTTSYSDHDYYVDAEGILCKKRYLGRRRYNSYHYTPNFDTGRLVNWLNGRCVGRVGDKFFWFVPVGKSKKHRGTSHDRPWRTQWGPPSNSYYYYGSFGLRWEYLVEENIYKKDSVGRYLYEEVDGRQRPIVIGREKIWKTGSKPFLRQGRKLDKEEMEFWNSLPSYYQTKILEESPNYPNIPVKYYSGYYY